MSTGRRIQLSTTKMRIILDALQHLASEVSEPEISDLYNEIDDGSAPSYSGSITVFPESEERR